MFRLRPIVISIVSLLILVGAVSASAAVKVVTSTTDLAWLVKEVGGNFVEVQSLLKGNENPHYVDTVPEFIREVAEAQLVCIVGLDLEIGWMPKVLSKSGNAQVQPGGKGYCEVGKSVAVIEKPTGGVDRSMGDIHPSGNPHFWVSPEAMVQASAEVVEGLGRVDPEHAADYRNNGATLKVKLEKLLKDNRAKLAPLIAKTSGPVLVEYHKEFSYFITAYGLKSFGSLEEKPGVPPSAGRIAEVALASKSAKIKFMLAAETSPKRTIEKFVELSGLPLIKTSPSLQAKDGKFNYVGKQNELVNSVVEILQGKK